MSKCGVLNAAFQANNFPYPTNIKNTIFHLASKQNFGSEEAQAWAEVISAQSDYTYLVEQIKRNLLAMDSSIKQIKYLLANDMDLPSIGVFYDTKVESFFFDRYSDDFKVTPGKRMTNFLELYSYIQD